MNASARRGIDPRVPVDMTPMIDVVFQLLAFFMMSLRVVDTEGEFHIRMPVAECWTSNVSTLPRLQLQLTASAEGQLSGIRLNERSFATLTDLRHHLVDLVSQVDPTERQILEIELACDAHLEYQHTMAAITAVSGEPLPHGGVTRMIDKIRFSPPGRP